MTEPAPAALPAPKPPKPKAGSLHVFHFVTLILALAGFLVLVLWPRPLSNNGPRPGGLSLNDRVATLEHKVANLENRMDGLGASAPGAAAPTAPTGTVTRLQGDVAALSAALDTVQAEVRRGSQNQASSQRAAQSLFAAAIAFMQLREAASSGHGYVEELAAMKVATRDDTAFAMPLAQLEPYALNGVPTAPALYQRFQSLAIAARRAIDESEAQNWWQRILVELRDLVIIRPVDSIDGANDALANIESDLAEGVIGTALDAAKGLPPAATETLKGWEQEAEARQTVDRSLQQMAELLIAAALPPREAAPASPASPSAPATAPAATSSPDADAP
ncbi:MAG TPA: hypothetical protein VMV79_03785 [Alphaproteobacteria bacterium]|nr:hypothetical protein [Alphaproteobacteria bacterium]